MSDGAQLLIPFAACAEAAATEALRRLSLPSMERLLARLVPAERDGAGAQTLSMPHELALARLAGLPAVDGRIPLAAWDAQRRGIDTGGQACAWITPCHWQVGAQQVFMHAPVQLQLAQPQARQLFDAMQPYFDQDGIELVFASADRWFARGELFDGLPLASLDRVSGRVLDGWMPAGAEGRKLRRLQQEMQMLLYTHRVTDERAEQGLLPVNSFWASGAGALPQPPAWPADLVLDDSLREPALLQDWEAWSAAWRRIDEGPAARLLQQLQEGRRVAVTLCGERHARTWRSDGAGWMQRLSARWSRKPVAESSAEL
jgi:hypothetical protein